MLTLEIQEESLRNHNYCINYKKNQIQAFKIIKSSFYKEEDKNITLIYDRITDTLNIFLNQDANLEIPFKVFFNISSNTLEEYRALIRYIESFCSLIHEDR